MHLLSEAGLLHLAATYGVWAVFVSVAIEATGLPVPSESILIAVAALAAGDGHGLATLAPIILAAAAGAVLGDNLGYGIGRLAGEPVLRWLGLSRRRRRLGRYLFQRYGGRIVFVARFVSVLRTFVSLLAGTTRMPWPRFLLYNVLGAATWASLVGGGAFLLGRQVQAWSWTVTLVFAGLVAVALLAGARGLRRREAALQAEADRALPEAA